MRKTTEPKIFIVLVNYNRLKDTIECIESLRKISYPNYEIIVIENGSTDDSYDKLSEIKDILLIRSDVNQGFTGGNNLGIQIALEKLADYVLLLNNDTVVEENFLSELVRVAEADDKIGLVGCKILYYYEKNKIWSAGGGVTPLLKRTFQYGENKIDRGQFDQQREVDFVSGCCMLIRRQVFEKIGLLDPDYFMYYEDVDFCLRAKNNGFQVTYCPNSVIWHKVSIATDKSFRDYYRMRNYILFLKKNFTSNKIVHLFYGMLIFCERFCRILIRKFFLKDKEKIDKRLKSLTSGWKKGLTF